jgi:hypothetical protein
MGKKGVTPIACRAPLETHDGIPPIFQFTNPHFYENLEFFSRTCLGVLFLLQNVQYFKLESRFSKRILRLLQFTVSMSPEFQFSSVPVDFGLQIGGETNIQPIVSSGSDVIYSHGPLAQFVSFLCCRFVHFGFSFFFPNCSGSAASVRTNLLSCTRLRLINCLHPFIGCKALFEGTWVLNMSFEC